MGLKGASWHSQEQSLCTISEADEAHLEKQKLDEISVRSAGLDAQKIAPARAIRIMSGLKADAKSPPGLAFNTKWFMNYCIHFICLKKH